MAGDKGVSAIYMTAPFLAGQGSATAKGYVGHVRLLSLNFSATRKTQKEISKDKSQDKKDVGQGTFSEFTMTKHLDDASGELMARAAEGVRQDPTSFEIVICSTRTASNGQPVEYAMYDLQDAVLTKYEIKFSGSEITEEITVAYGSALIAYQPIDSKTLKTATTRINYEAGH